MLNFLNNQAISIIALIGLIVLVALNKVTADVAVPVIVGLTGVHIGANAVSNASNNGTPTPTPAPPTPKPAPPAAQ